MDLKKKKFQVPHTYVIIGILLTIITILTHIVPAGSFDRVEDAELGRTMVVQGSFKFVEQSPVSPFRMFMAIVEGMVSASDIIFFIFFAYAFVFLLVKTGAFYGAMGTLLKKFKGKEFLILPFFMVMFGICGSTFGLYEEVYGLLPAFIGIAIALGYDGLVGGAAVVLGTATGFAAATLNPFSIGIAQGIAGLPIGSGVGFRVVCFIVFQSTAILYLMNYARKVKHNPECSIVKGVKFKISEGMTKEKMEALPFNGKHKFIMFLFVCTVGGLVYGTSQLGWYLTELSDLFLIMTIIIGVIGGYGLSEIANFFVEAVSDVIFGALVVGIARSLSIIMEEGKIIDTFVYYISGGLTHLSTSIAAIGMVVAQNIINFFIPSGSGQAATSMPIMIPLADAIGMNRQIAVLAFQFGDGFSNMFWPTVVATECGLMGLPIEKWYKFMTPLFIIFVLLQFVMITVSVLINYGPF